METAIILLVTSVICAVLAVASVRGREKKVRKQKEEEAIFVQNWKDFCKLNQRTDNDVGALEIHWKINCATICSRCGTQLYPDNRTGKQAHYFCHTCCESWTLDWYYPNEPEKYRNIASYVWGAISLICFISFLSAIYFNISN